MTNSLYENLLKEFKNDLEFKLEYQSLAFTEQICKLMEKDQITKKELSMRLETSEHEITQILVGNTNFTLKKMIKIASAFNREINIFIK